MDDNQSTVTPETQEEGQPKTYTQEEVDALLQSEADRRVTAALKKAEEKSKAKAKEAEKLAQMNATQKYEYELEQREAEIERKEHELLMSENKNEAAKILSEKGLSLDFVDFVVAEDAETMDSNIKLIEKAFKASVRSEVERRLKTPSPQKSLEQTEAITPEQFKKMTLPELLALSESNPELYKQLKGN